MTMKRIGRAVVIVTLGISLLAFFGLPVIETNSSGQSFLLGYPITPPPTDGCASFGCHCLVHYSLSAWLLGIGYRQVGPCP